MLAVYVQWICGLAMHCAAQWRQRLLKLATTYRVGAVIIGRLQH